MAADGERTVFEICERGFDGELVIEGGAAGHVHVSGTRSKDETAVGKDVPADRDPKTHDLVGRCLAGDEGAAVDLLAHLGVLDPA